MATYEELGLSAAIADKLIEASETPGLSKLATPEGAKAFVDAGGSLADVVKGVGPEYEKDILEALLKLPTSDQDQNASSSTPVEPAVESVPTLARPAGPVPAVPAEPVVPAGPTVEVGPTNDDQSVYQSPDGRKFREMIAETEVTLRLPLGPLPTGYRANQANAGRITIGRRYGQKAQLQMSESEAKTFLRILEGCRHNDRRLANGKCVDSHADVIRLLLEPFMDHDEVA